MNSFEEALELISQTALPLGTEPVALGAAMGRVLAAPVIARIDSPRSDVSAMDGYAVREADLSCGETRLRIVGESFAGAGWSGSVGSGQCVRIFTGAAVPPGADRVVIQECVSRDGDLALILRRPDGPRHIRRRGGDFDQGDELLTTGRLLHNRAVVAAAGADVASVEVFFRPRVFILSTGDELAEPGIASKTPDAIPESVSFGVAAMAIEGGAELAGRLRLRDELEEMKEAAGHALADTDLVIVTGGASVGEKDFAKTMFEPGGLEMIFSKVSIKPGKPVWLGRSGKTLVMGLPGNPTSALVTARLLMMPLLAGLGGRDPRQALRWRRAKLTSPLPACGERETFHRARESGEEVDVFAFQDSSAQKVLADADVLVRQSANSPAIAAGEMVQILDF